jgi:UDP-2,4-diacetamido-2,4,6-trideoxy-beta-L-altropyranose hydrolase
MRVVFRTDASIDIGNGHVMRCLTLAMQLSAYGSTCSFICRPLAGNLIDKISQLGFEVVTLAVSDAPRLAASNGNTVADYDWEADARHTLSAIGSNLDWIVVDHYALDERWEAKVRGAARRLLVIDDLADRHHDADMLLDQNAGRQATDYKGLVPAVCEVLAGPRFALLRSEFGVMRRSKLQRNRDKVRRLLVSMGGVDKDNASNAVLDHLAASDLPEDTTISVVLGPHSPHIAAVRQRATKMHWPTKVLVDVDDMASLMADSDLAIGAAGVSALERCCIGLPSIIIPVASNQIAGARALARDGAVVIASLEPSDRPSVCDSIASLLWDGALQAAALACASVTDGSGARAVAGRMSASVSGARLRRMRASDLDAVLTWRNAPEIRFCMLQAGEITTESHEAWFKRNSVNPDRELMIVEDNGQPVGFVQYSGLQDRTQPEWGFYAAPCAPKGTGSLLATLALEYAFGRLGLPRLIGRVLATNTVSIRFHEKFGFRLQQVNKMLEGNPLMQTYELLREDWEQTQGVIA